MMTIENKMAMLVENGYLLLENVIPENLLADCRNIFSEKLVKLGASQEHSFSDQYRTLTKNIHPYEINKLLMREIVGSGLALRLFHSTEILNCFIHIIGPDLAYQTNSELPVNVKGETNDSLVKKFHQEFWTGPGHRTFTFWTPLILSKGAGTLELIRKSHTWGHVPHQNREPKFIPSDAELQIIDCKEGDALIFHSLMLHRTVPNKIDCPRLAYATQVRNMNDPDSNFDRFNSWEVFNLSPATRILKECGNVHLSPFRTYGSTRAPIKPTITV
ncbi:MAG: hypothetical protein A3F11_03230 [Gammaproteobacteria bacterium RIFCSPHIGHO2_12_FULL_37_14]|nr:MAG: hypothetical protein A3F11_03230 [Gammaproteobacteria bacterium RIFCSPHIGHO2_12_FULL_37_14]